VLYILFFFPGILALIYFGTIYAAQAWSQGEVSVYSPASIPIYPLKSLIPLAGVFLLVQGVAEVMRCIICVRDGAWPRRLHDVEEIETAVLHVHEDEARISDRPAP
jgi:TRAP-type mannitol/chloroaromatic compound transport system permease small subunit